MNDVIERILVTEEEIIKRSKELGAVITQDYRDAGKTPIVVGLLKGSVPFLAEIMKHIDLDIEIDFMDVSSYDGAQSVGDVKINKDLDKSVKGESILLVEDIVDTGQTIERLVETISAKNPSEVKIATLLFKPESLQCDVKPDYVGFAIPPKFIIGFGLDLDGLARNLKDIYVLKETAD